MRMTLIYSTTLVRFWGSSLQLTKYISLRITTFFRILTCSCGVLFCHLHGIFSIVCLALLPSMLLLHSFLCQERSFFVLCKSFSIDFCFSIGYVVASNVYERVVMSQEFLTVVLSQVLAKVGSWWCS